MGELREIVDVAAVGRLFLLLAVLLPIAGALVGAILGARRRDLRRGLRIGLTVGLLGPLNWGMWHVYNALTERNGLDTVRNVFVNLALFVGVGAILGVGIGLALRRSGPAEREEDARTNERPT